MLLQILAVFVFVWFSSERMKVEIGSDRVFEARDGEVRRGERSCSREIGSAMYVQERSQARDLALAKTEPM